MCTYLWKGSSLGSSGKKRAVDFDFQDSSATSYNHRNLWIFILGLCKMDTCANIFILKYFYFWVAFEIHKMKFRCQTWLNFIQFLLSRISFRFPRFECYLQGAVQDFYIFKWNDLYSTDRCSSKKKKKLTYVCRKFIRRHFNLNSVKPTVIKNEEKNGFSCSCPCLSSNFQKNKIWQIQNKINRR